MSAFDDIYDIRILTDEDFEAVRKIVLEEYFSREPVSRKLDLTAEEAKLSSDSIIQEALKHQFSLGAFDRVTGDLIGCRISVMRKKMDGDVFPENLDDSPLKIRQLFGIVMSFFKNGGIAGVLKTEDYMQGIFLVCRKDRSQKGLGTELMRRSLKLAEQEGCKKFFTIAFSHYVQRIGRRLGFTTVEEILYEDYVDPYTRTRIFCDIAEPHRSASLVVINL